MKWNIIPVTTTNEYTFTINNSNVSYILVGVVFLSGSDGASCTYSNIQCKLSSTSTVTLDAPLTASEYIDIVNKKRYNGSTATNITIDSDLKTLDSEENTIFCKTAIHPSKIELSYWQNIDKMKTNNATIVNNNTDTSVVINMEADHEYRYFIALTDLTMKLTDNPANNYISSIVFKTNKDSFTFTAPNNCKFIGDDCDNGTFTPLKNSKYDVVVVYDGEEYIGYVGCRTNVSSQGSKLYTAGNGISISDTNEISAKVLVGNGLSVDNAGIKMESVTTTASGAMSADDKIKLDALPTNAELTTELNDIRSENTNKIIYGTYTGNGNNVRIIDIGVTPTIVYVQPTDNPTYSTAKIYYGGLALAGVPYKYIDDTRFVIQCVENGFKVCEASENGTYTWSCSTNTNNRTYSFVAIVGGEQKNIS